MADIFIRKLNSVYAQIECSTGISHELHEHFSYYAENYMWSPKYKYSSWDGRIKEFSLKTRTIRLGLYFEVKKFAESNSYSFEDDGNFGYSEFSVTEAETFIRSLNLPKEYQIRDYQLKAFVGAVRENRCIRVLPTSSGKSLIIHILSRFYDGKVLVIVPTINLVQQMSSDFYEYGYKKKIHQITAGVDKDFTEKIGISTWQSIFKQPKEYFDQFDVIIVDEVHLATAASLKGIMDKAVNAQFRFGFSGTLKEAKTSEMCLTGMFGKIHKVISTAELIEQGYAAELKIKCLVLKYPEHIREQNKKLSYQEEKEFIITCKERNNFIKNLALSLPDNTFIFFHNLSHGKYLYELISSNTNRPVYYIAGSVSGDEREEIRKIVEKENDAIIIASSKTSSTGLNIKNLRNIIFASPSKSKITVLQSIGRALRKMIGKDVATLFDIADDLHWKSHLNHTLSHFKERLKIYLDEKFKFKIYEIDLKVN